MMDFIKAFNEYGILLNDHDIRICSKDKCIEEAFSILHGKFISKYFKEAKLSEWIVEINKILQYKNVAKALTKHVYSMPKKRIHHYSEDQYDNIKDEYWYQITSLKKQQFKYMVNFIHKKIKNTCK